MIKADTHFHTNFFFPLEFLVRRRAKQIWAQWEKQGYDLVILSEHAFKSPVKSYLKLMQYRPKDARTLVVPGVECVTKEGIDVIVFSKDKYIYKQRDVIATYKMTVEELIDTVEADPRLYGVCTHPFILSDTAVSLHRDDAFIKDMVKRLGILEKHNSTLMPLKKFYKFLGLHKLLGFLYRRMEKVDNVPDEFLVDGATVFGGSDAHYPRDIGPHLEIEGDFRDDDELFELLVSGKGKQKFIYNVPNSFPIPIFLIVGGLTTLFETLKKRLRLFKHDYLERYE